jgi:[ribosomal protein S18]-alanine N-acetyltransferase
LIALFVVDSESDEQSQMIGMACLWSIVEEAHITLLGIHPAHRHQGLGQLLLLTLLKNAIARQLEWATLEVNQHNLAAINLYQKYGFQIAGTRKNYYQPAGDDALVLWLKGIQQEAFKVNLIQWQQRLGDRLSRNYYYFKQTKFC